jgi:hypothetical protein
MTIETSPTENVARGAVFTLAVIPAGMAAFALTAYVFDVASGIAAIAIPSVAAWLYAKGAGAPLSKKGWVPFVSITAIAVVVGVATGIVAGAFYAFNKVGGDGGLLSPAFLTSVSNRITSGEATVTILLGLALGAGGIIGVVRNSSKARTTSVADAPAAEPEK